MSDRQDILNLWSFPYTQRGGVTLVARSDAAECVRRIVAGHYQFLGYDSFTLSTEGWIQPHMEWSPDWSRSGAPEISDILAQLEGHPAIVTHYELVFRKQP